MSSVENVQLCVNFVPLLVFITDNAAENTGINNHRVSINNGGQALVGAPDCKGPC